VCDFVLRHFFDTFASCSSVTGETVARTGGVVASTTTGAILASLSTEARVNDAINVELVQTGTVHTSPGSGTDSSVELKLVVSAPPQVPSSASTEAGYSTRERSAPRYPA